VSLTTLRQNYNTKRGSTKTKTHLIALTVNKMDF